MRTAGILALTFVSACSFDPPPTIDDPAIDGAVAMPDAAVVDGTSTPTRAFDVAYIDRWRLTGYSGQVPFDPIGEVLLVNTGTMPLDPTTFAVSGYSDDNAMAGYSVGRFSDITSNSLEPGQASGELSATARAVIVDSGLVTEQRVDTMTAYISMHVGNMASGDYVINAHMKLALDGKEVELPVTIEHREGNINAEYLSAARVAVVID